MGADSMKYFCLFLFSTNQKDHTRELISNLDKSVAAQPGRSSRLSVLFNLVCRRCRIVSCCLPCLSILPRVPYPQPYVTMSTENAEPPTANQNSETDQEQASKQQAADSSIPQNTDGEEERKTGSAEDDNPNGILFFNDETKPAPEPDSFGDGRAMDFFSHLARRVGSPPTIDTFVGKTRALEERKGARFRKAKKRAWRSSSARRRNRALMKGARFVLVVHVLHIVLRSSLRFTWCPV